MAKLALTLLPTSDFRLKAGITAFPLHELYISTVILLLIAAGLYFFAGAWGIVLLWGLGLIFVLPQIAAAIGLFINGSEELAKGNRLVAAGCYLGGAVWAALWAAGVGYCGYSLYHAIP